MFMLQSIVLRRLIPITVGASLLLVGQLPAAELSEILKKKVPEGVGDLRALEGVARKVARRGITCTVAVRVGSVNGSGVLISADGHVLTAAHVIGDPGRRCQVIMPDGRRFPATTLGVHTQADLGLVKLDDKGPWPFANMVDVDWTASPGMWCLTIGHTRGFQRTRTAPVRLGRVVEVRENVMRTDCPITSGDSGGPLFDLQGRVIGIHSRISEDATENYHGPVAAARQAWAELKAGEIYPKQPPSHFLAALDVDRDGVVNRNELKDDLRRQIFDRFAEEYQLDPQKPHSVVKLAEQLGWQQRPLLTLGESVNSRLSDPLPRKFYMRGRLIRRAFAPVAAKVAKSTVRVVCDGKRVALGTVVADGNLVLTKASMLQGQIQCELSDGRRIAAQQVNQDEQHDLAILKVKGDKLPVVTWHQEPVLSAGTWLVSPGAHGTVASIGIVSVEERRIDRARAVLGVVVDDTDAGAKIESVQPGSGASDAGLSAGDTIRSINGKAVRTLDDVRLALKPFRPGDVVTLSTDRAGRERKIRVTLGAASDVFYRFSSELTGPLSLRRDDFPEVVQHDSLLAPRLCGGPVIDLSGKTVGINIARADRVATYLLPASEVQDVMKLLRQKTATPSTRVNP